MTKFIHAAILLGGGVFFYAFCMLAAIVGSCWLLSVFAPAFFAGMSGFAVFVIYFLANMVFWLVVLPHLPQ